MLQGESMSVNNVCFSGHLTRDVDLKYSQKGYAVASTAIAVNSTTRKGDNTIEEVNYFDIVIYGKMAENLKPYLTKGKHILVVCRAKQDRWEKDGQKFSKVVFIVEHLDFLGGNKNSQQQQPQQNIQQQSQQQNTVPTEYEQQGFDIFPEDIPF